MTLDGTDSGSEFLADLSLSDSEADSSRADCGECLRPVTVCWCPHLPSPRLEVATKIIVLQHPGELKRNIRTCRMLELGLAPHCVSVKTGRKFPGRHQDLSLALSHPTTRLLYPGPGAQPLDSPTPPRSPAWSSWTGPGTRPGSSTATTPPCRGWARSVCRCAAPASTW